MHLSDLLLVLVHAVLVVGVDLPHARRVDQELCKAASTAVSTCSAEVTARRGALTSRSINAAVLSATEYG